MSELLDFQNGINADSSQYGHGIKYISVMDILNNDYIIYSNIRGMVDINEKTLNHYSVEYGDIVFQRSSETMEDVGNTNVYLDKEKVATFGGFVIRGKKKSDYEPFFLKNLLCSPPSRKKIVRMGAGSQHFNIGQDSLSKIVIPLPSITEQQKISFFLSLLDKRITKQRELVESLKSYKRGALSKLFPQNGETTPQYRFAGFTDVWEQYKLGDIGETYTGLFGKTKEDFGHGNAKFVTYLNVFSNPIADSTMTEAVEIDKKQNGVKYGDIFFTTSSETPDEVGMSSVWLENSDNTYLNSFCFGYRLNTEINRFYIAYMLRSETVRKNIIFLAQGISRYNISKNKMMEISIPFPTLDEQQKIGDYFLNLDRLITLHQRKLNEFETVKAGLLQQLFI